MANIKITDLNAYTDPKSTDVLPVVDVTNDLTKKVSIADLMENAGSGTKRCLALRLMATPILVFIALVLISLRSRLLVRSGC